MTPRFPTRPGDIPYTTPLQVLAERHQRHMRPLVAADRGEHPGREAFTAHALAALAYQAALLERAAATRWVTAVEALAAGATHSAVAAAAGLDVDQLRIGVGVWASGQRRAGFITAERHAQVMGLVGEVSA